MVVNLYKMSDGPEPDVSHIIHMARIEHNIQKKEGKRETGFFSDRLIEKVIFFTG